MEEHTRTGPNGEVIYVQPIKIDVSVLPMDFSKYMGDSRSNWSTQVVYHGWFDWDGEHWSVQDGETSYFSREGKRHMQWQGVPDESDRKFTPEQRREIRHAWLRDHTFTYEEAIELAVSLATKVGLRFQGRELLGAEMLERYWTAKAEEEAKQP